jgi:hypothetical protein
MAKYAVAFCYYTFIINLKENILNLAGIICNYSVILVRTILILMQDITCTADHSGRAFNGMNRLRPLEHLDIGFESNSRHGCLSVCVYSVFMLWIGRGFESG